MIVLVLALVSASCLRRETNGECNGSVLDSSRSVHLLPVR